MDKEKKYKYYFWLEEMIMDLWCQYIDLLATDSKQEVRDNKYKTIQFYESQLDELSVDFSYHEAYEWWRRNHTQLPNQRLCEKIFDII